MKNEFEYLFLESFEKMYRTAEQTAARMKSPASRLSSGKVCAAGSSFTGNIIITIS